MITIDELKMQMGDHRQATAELGDALAITASEKRVAELEHKMTMPGFYDDTEASGKVFSEMSALKGKLERYSKLKTLCDDADTMLLLCEEENDPTLIPEAEAAVNEVAKAVEELQLITLLSGQYDKNNAILTFHAGAGGTEAQDWTQMLYRMYTRFCERMGFTVKELDMLDGDEAGVKSVTFEVSGDHAYGYLRGEKGVHRLVRISPFDANARRHTSFASLDVAPMLEDDDSDIEINMKDVRVDTYHSSGAGGQNVNKTSSAVRMTHYPTGIVVSCQTERDQVQNRATCIKMLKAKLLELRERAKEEEMANIKGEMKKIEWGSQIRSYVFQPYTMVKDHRTNYESGNIDDVMDGNLEGFITAYLKMQ